MADVTQILNAIDAGDPRAAEQLLPLVYNELRQLAAAQLAEEKPGHTLQPTALVHEAYLRLVASGASDGPGGVKNRGHDCPRSPEFANRRHFFAAAAGAMRRILIDAARKKLTHKRGGGRQRLPLDQLAAPAPDDDLLALNEALDKLAAKDPLKARLVELRYFAGLTSDEAAKVLDISPTTADRHWAYARAWLRAEVRGE
jgi:RNA polymerase sigma factor (sigma-70 family)